MKPGLFFGLVCFSGFACGPLADGASTAPDEPALARAQAVTSAPSVGLSLLFTNGVAAEKTLVGLEPRYLSELDVVESVPSATDAGIEPLIVGSRISGLDWAGVEQVEEIWVPGLDGMFTRERYFRGARWMDERSVFRLQALGPNGAELGDPWVVHAGRDDRQAAADDVFVRRFVARQLAVGCASVGDCAGAHFVAEALVQMRGALHGAADARVVPPRTTSLRLSWNRLDGIEFNAPVERVRRSEAEFDAGFRVTLEPISTPANSRYYEPGESVSLRVSFLDGQGRRLHPVGQLPSYGAFVAGQVDSGLRYLDLSLSTRLYYALKHRESNLLIVLSGPVDRLRVPQTVVDPALFFGDQVPFATTAVDGFTALGQTLPPASIVFGGLADPSLWALPVSDVVLFTLPLDAPPGTYVAAVKARRDYGGEANNRGASVEILVGQDAPTAFTPATTCSTCHSGPSTGFGSVLHGLDDRRACFGCHASLGVEFDNALDIRVHTIHDRSDRFDADIHDCGVCHLATPEGPQRGVLP